MDDNVNLMNKKFSDLTIKDYVKLNVGALAVMAAIPVAIGTVAFTVDRVGSFVRARKNHKSVQLVNE